MVRRKYLVRKIDGRWTLGPAEEPYLAFDSKKDAVAHAARIESRLPKVEIVVVD